MVTPRVPLQAKVFLSFLAVLAAGAIPAFLYVEIRLEDRLLRVEAESLAARVRAIGRELAGLPVDVVQGRLAELAQVSEVRITGVRSSGDVFFDTDHNDPGRLVSHRSRPEVRQVLDEAEPSARAIDPRLPGIGVDRRRSETVGADLLYVATRVPGALDQPPWVLRLAQPTAPVMAVRDSAIVFLRNALAVSLSMALLLTLVAAVKITRPLERLSQAAAALANGDFGSTPPPVTRDEIGDVAKALQDLSKELRTRMAAAGTGEGILHQLVEGLRQPVMVFKGSGELVAVNGPGRRMLDVEGPAAATKAQRLAGQKRIRRVIEAAEEEGVPQAVQLSDTVTAYASVLHQPGTEPLWVLTGPLDVAEAHIDLPAPEDVITLRMESLLAHAQASARAVLESHEMNVVLPDAGIPDVMVCDAGDRAADAVAQLLTGLVANVSESSTRLALDFLVEAPRVGVYAEGRIDEEVTESIDALIEPLGGELEVDLGEVTLWLPRA